MIDLSLDPEIIASYISALYGDAETVSLFKMMSVLWLPAVLATNLMTAGSNVLPGTDLQIPPDDAALRYAQSHAPREKADAAQLFHWPFDKVDAQRRQREAAARLGLPVEKRFALAPGVELVCILIPDGTFMQGRKAFPPSTTEEQKNREFTRAELPLHRVTISRPFYLGKYEITQAQWLATGAKLPPHPQLDEAKGTLPVEYIFWAEVEQFLPLLQKKLPADWRCRVPTESEWEYSCRAGTDTPFYFGQTITPEQVSGAKAVPVVSVGSLPPNAWGLHDMHGSVWEYCADYYDPQYYERSPVVDPLCRVKPASLHDVEGHVLRGGSHGYDDFYARSAHRGWAGEKLNTFERIHERGLRIVIEPPVSIISQ